jgi:hypothetical protein
MTREEMQAVVETVLDAPRTEPGRLDTIMRAADQFALDLGDSTYESGYFDGRADEKYGTGPDAEMAK